MGASFKISQESDKSRVIEHKETPLRKAENVKRRQNSVITEMAVLSAILEIHGFCEKTFSNHWVADVIGCSPEMVGYINRRVERMALRRFDRTWLML